MAQQEREHRAVARPPIGRRRGPAADDVRYAAGRAGTLHRLIADGIPPGMAEAWLATWEARLSGARAPGRDQLPWDEGYAFAVRQWAAGRTPHLGAAPAARRRAG